MALEPVLIAGEWRQPANPSGSFKAIDPTAGKPLPESYPVSSIDDVTAAFRAAEEAALALREIPADAIGRVPRRLRGAHRGRRRRAGGTRRARDRPAARRPACATSSCRARPASFARARPPRASAPGARRRSTPRRTCARATGRSAGPWSCSGPTTSRSRSTRVAGGDFVAAIAAGNPVIGKANTGHPGTSKLLAELALEAARAAGLPPGDGPAALPDAARGRLRAGLRRARRRHRLHGQQERRPQAEGGGRPGGQADLPRDVEHQPGVRAAARARRARRRDRQGAVRLVSRWGRGSSARAPAWPWSPKGDKGAAFVAELAGAIQGGHGRHAARPVGRDRDRRGAEGAGRERRARPRRRPPRRRRSRGVRADAARGVGEAVPGRAARAADRGVRHASTPSSSPTTSRRWPPSRPPWTAT